MAKQGQHKHDANDQRIAKGPNKHHLSQPITTGSYKKPETYRKQATERKDPNKQAQYAKNEWNEDTRDRSRMQDAKPREGRSGSDSNSSNASRGY